VNEPQAWIVSKTVAGAFCWIAEHDAIRVAEILPLDAGNGPEVGLHCHQKIVADALQHWFAVLCRRRFTEQTSRAGGRLRKHNG